MNVDPRSTWQTNAKSALIELPQVDLNDWTSRMLRWVEVEARRVQATQRKAARAKLASGLKAAITAGLGSHRGVR